MKHAIKIIGRGFLAASLLLGLSDAVNADPTLTPAAALIVDSSHISRGGVREGTTHRALLDVSLGIQWENMPATSWSSLYISAEAMRGDDAGQNAGVLQAFSNIDEGEFEKLYELWYQYQYAGTLRIKLGRVDANSEFAVADQAGAFMHSSMGFSPTVLSLPTYPDPKLSANAFYSINDSVAVNLGLYDSNGEDDFDELFSIAELVIGLGERSKVKLGAWRDSASTETLRGEIKSATRGYYLTADHSIPLDQAEGELGLFLQLGVAENNDADIHHHLGAGVVWRAPFGVQEATGGLGVSAIELSDIALRAVGKNRETALELFLAYQLTDFLKVRPTVHYIDNPAAAPGIPDALVFTVRAEIGF